MESKEENKVLGGVIRAAKEMKINPTDEIRVGDSTEFAFNGRMLAVEVVRVHEGWVDLRSLDLKHVFNNVSKTHWLRQIEFMKQIP